MNAHHPYPFRERFRSNSARASSRAWRGRAATSPGSLPSSFRLAASGGGAQGDRPARHRVAFIFNPNTAPYAELFVKPFKGAAGSLGVAPITAPVRDASEIEAVVAALAGEPNGGFIVMPDVFLLADALKLPSSPLVTGFLPSILSVPSPKSAVSFPTEMTTSTFTNARRAMPIASLRARSRANFHSSSPSSLS